MNRVSGLVYSRPNRSMGDGRLVIEVGIMPSFFLDVLNGSEVLEDPEGQDFANLDAAITEAVASARDLVAHAIMQNEDVSGRSFLIRAEKEQTVATVPFRSALPGTLGGWALPVSMLSAQLDVTANSAAARISDRHLLGPLATLDAAFERLVVEYSRALQEGERRFRNLIEGLPAAIYMTDAEGRITFYNEAAVEFSGRRPVLGQDRWCVTWRLYRPDGTRLPHEQCPMAIALKENRPVRGAEAVAERPNGTRILFMPFPTPLRDASGALVGGVNMLVETPTAREPMNGSAPTNTAALME